MPSSGVVANWNGLVTVVLYLSDVEVLNLIEMIRLSSVLSRRRTTIVYHVVYKRPVRANYILTRGTSSFYREWWPELHSN